MKFIKKELIKGKSILPSVYTDLPQLWQRPQRKYFYHREVQSLFFPLQLSALTTSVASTVFFLSEAQTFFFQLIFVIIFPPTNHEIRPIGIEGKVK